MQWNMSELFRKEKDNARGSRGDGKMKKKENAKNETFYKWMGHSPFPWVSGGWASCE